MHARGKIANARAGAVAFTIARALSRYLTLRVAQVRMRLRLRALFIDICRCALHKSACSCACARGCGCGCDCARSSSIFVGARAKVYLRTGRRRERVRLARLGRGISSPKSTAGTRNSIEKQGASFQQTARDVIFQKIGFVS